MPKKYGQGAKPYGMKYSKSGQGSGGSKLGPRYGKTPTALTPKQKKADTVTTSDYKKPTTPGSKAVGSTRTSYGDKGAGSTAGRSNYKVPKIPGSKRVKSHADKT